jgi:hypothetical protein
LFNLINNHQTRETSVEITCRELFRRPLCTVSKRDEDAANIFVDIYVSLVPFLRLIWKKKFISHFTVQKGKV